MTKTQIGIILIVIGVGTKSAFGHLARDWALIETLSLGLYVVGLTFLIFNHITKIEKRKKVQFKKNPIKWTFQRSFFVYISTIPLIIGLFWTGRTLNSNIKEYFLGKNTISTNATLIGIEKQSYLIRFSEKSKDFYLFKYETEDGVLTHGLPIAEFELFEQNKNGQIEFPKNQFGQSVEILYSMRFPSFFKIK